jgi:hypothetical protein
MSNKFVGFLEAIGKAFMKVIIPFAPMAEAAVNTFLPALGPAFTATSNAVIAVEQKYAALGQQNGTGAQKLQEVLQLSEPVIAQFLADAGKAHDTAAVTAYINSVVGVLNMAPAPAATQ